MKSFQVIILIFLSTVCWAGVEFQVRNQAYAYNGESGTAWEETRTTLTYLENLFEPSVIFRTTPGLAFQAGIGVLTPYNQEIKVSAFYPVLLFSYEWDIFQLRAGTMRNSHDLPAPLLDPLTAVTPQVRLVSKSQLPLNTNESYTAGEFTHGLYEYGISLGWKNAGLTGEAWVNWQLLDLPLHRERFDMGLVACYRAAGMPLYAALHYWHNGGHENPHPVSITENYTLAAGLHDTSLDVLYLASYLLPDRDSNPALNTFGQGLYLRYAFPLWMFTLETEGFVSSRVLFADQQFVSVEGDPFYRIPLYLGINLKHRTVVSEEFTIEVSFINGIFLTAADAVYDPRMVRYDQFIRLDYLYKFGEGRTNI